MRNDEDLMQAAARGDLDAFGELVRRYQRYAWNIAWRLLQDPIEAEDAAQEAFIKILEAAPRYRPLAAFQTYLCRIVTRLCLDRLEKKCPDYTDRLPDSAAPDPDPSDKLAEREDAAVLHRILDSLPPRQRAALILRHYEDLSYREIAKSMGISVKSVERLLAHGREKLSVLLNEMHKRKNKN